MIISEAKQYFPNPFDLNLDEARENINRQITAISFHKTMGGSKAVMLIPGKKLRIYGLFLTTCRRKGTVCKRKYKYGKNRYLRAEQMQNTEDQSMSTSYYSRSALHKIQAKPSMPAKCNIGKPKSETETIMNN